MNSLNSIPSVDASVRSGTAGTGTPESVTEADSPIEADSLIEEISIDGMCGVY